MKKDKQYRHELKYYINQGDYTLISNKLSRTMMADANTDENAEYFIRSLYFDDEEDTSFREKLDGVDCRDKIRIRCYNHRYNEFSLERKHKKDGFIQKDSIMLSPEEYRAVMRRDYRFLLKRPEPFARVMFTVFSTKYLTPKVIVDYTREVYVFPVENVRVSFDKDIRTAYRATDITDKNLTTYSVVEEGIVMEVKFDNYLPTYIRYLIQAEAGARSAISKYCLCRKLEL